MARLNVAKFVPCRLRLRSFPLLPKQKTGNRVAGTLFPVTTSLKVNLLLMQRMDHNEGDHKRPGLCNKCSFPLRLPYRKFSTAWIPLLYFLKLSKMFHYFYILIQGRIITSVCCNVCILAANVSRKLLKSG